MSLTTQSSLLERLRQDGSEVWEEFSRLYRPFLVRVAVRLGLRGQDVDDAVQGTLVDLYQGRSQFVYDRCQGHFRAYLQKILHSWTLKMRHQQQRAGLPMAALPETGAGNQEPEWEEEYRHHLLRIALERVRHEVEPKTYQAFQLHGLEQMATEEVARFLGISRAAVYTYKHRVLARLRAIVQEEIKRCDGV